MKTKTWRSTSKITNNVWESNLLAWWEVHLDPLSDDYTPDAISAENLFDIWVSEVLKTYPGGLLPIFWSVKGYKQFEKMPFQYDHSNLSDPDDFLTYNTWPVNIDNGEELNWLSLPVVDKGWNLKKSDKGGFIQQATGWKPSILQPFVYLKSLANSKNG